ncbi:MAG: 2-oxo acid dehydrogenase subunit E2 [Salinirussus sp.]
MERELELPDVGEGIAEGEIVRWLVEPGDRVTEDQQLAEVETDKAVVEVPSPTDGTVTELHAAEGEVVAVGSVIVTFEVDDGTTAADAGGADDTGETAPASQVVAPPRVKRLARELGVDIGAIDGANDGDRITEADVRRAAGDGVAAGSSPSAGTADSDVSGAGSSAGAAELAATGSSSSVEPADREKTLAAPATRQLARELGVDIDRVPATERRDGHAFVTPEAVRAFAEGGSETAAAEPPHPTNGTAPTGAAGTADADVDASTAAREEREERVPYRGVRRTIGQQMERSKYTAPHVSHHDSVVVTDLVETRRELNAETGNDVSLTYLPFVMKAVVAGLEEFPEINATLDEEAGEIVRKRYYNLGVATATDAGLMVPVVEDVDRKGLVDLAREAADLVERARDREIAPDEMQGGTFTITNFGTVGGEYATPIINFPEAAILGLGAIEQRPVVADGEVVARHTLPLSLTVDHRLIDGAEAAAFVNEVKRYLNDPSLLLL